MATDERRRGLRYVREKLGEGRVINTWLVGPGDPLEGYRFRMRFRSFADVLDKS